MKTQPFDEPSPPLRSVNEDDIAQLRKSLQMPDFGYVDFSARRERDDALLRWPLLRELDAAHAETAATGASASAEAAA